VTAAVAFVGLFVLTGALFLVPLIPAIVELRLKRDAKPLNVIQQYAGDIRHFSQGFRIYTSDLLGPLNECVSSGGTATGTLPHGDQCLLLGSPDASQLLQPGSSENTCDFVVLTGTNITLPSGMTFKKELFASRQITAGGRCTYRAILCDSDVHLGRASHVSRWAHAAGKFQAEENCDLFGRISSDREIELLSGSLFQRLNAPRIAFGAVNETQEREPSIAISSDVLANGVAATRQLVDNDLEIAPGAVIAASIVTRGNLTIGAGARIFGSAKSHKHMRLGEGALVAGSLISVSTIHIGPNCQVAGPVIAEHGLEIESGTRCGTAEKPTTVSAPTMQIEEGAVVYGTIWARQEGQVLACK
jgi:predicted acyltransferase (DUF342 family)